MVVSMVGIPFSHEERFMSAAKTPPSVIGQVRGIFPKLGELTDKVVFGDVWERKGLSKAERRQRRADGEAGVRRAVGMKIGFIGLGAMGAPMAASLERAGHAVQSFDL